MAEIVKWGVVIYDNLKGGNLEKLKFKRVGALVEGNGLDDIFVITPVTGRENYL